MILEEKLFLKSRFRKKIARKKSPFSSFYAVKCANFAFYLQL